MQVGIVEQRKAVFNVSNHCEILPLSGAWQLTNILKFVIVVV